MVKKVNFLKLLRQFSAPICAVILMIFGSAFYTTFLSLFLNSKGVPQSEIGYLHSMFFLGLLVGAFFMENLIKRVGHIQSLAVFGSLATSSTLIQGLEHEYWVWLATRFLNGISLAAIYIVIESWMLYESTPRNRGVILSIYMMSFYAAQSLSQQVIGFIDINTYTPFMLSALFTSLSIIPVGLSVKRITYPPDHESMGFMYVMKKSPLGVAGCITSGLLLSAVYSFLPLVALSRGILSKDMMTATIAGGFFLQWPIGKLSDYFDRRKILILMIALSLAVCLTNYFFREFAIQMSLLLTFLVGGFLFTLYPLSISQVCDHLDNSQVTTATALLLVAYGVGSVSGPVLSSWMIQQKGIDILYLYFSVLLALLLLLGLWSAFFRPKIPIEDQEDFVPLPNVTPVANEMDPRGEEN